MREKNGWYRSMKIGMAAALGLLLILLAFREGRRRYIEYRVRWENEGQSWTQAGQSLAGRLVEIIWNQGLLWRQVPEADGQEAFSLAAALEGLNPWYAYGERKEEAAGWEELDPAYRDYLAGQEFYREYAWMYPEGEGGAEEVPPSQSAQTAQDAAGQAAAAVPGTQYSLAQLADYDFLMKTFYNVHTSTTASRSMMNAEAMLEKDFTLEKNAAEPQILIYHTHSQEAFADSGPGETVVAIGEYLAELLTAKGYGVIHDTGVYDLRNGELDRSQAYNYALEGITAILQENPSIQVILDVHRDGVAEGTHLAAEVNGKPTAKIMFFNGLSQTPDGPVEYLPNPYRDDNLAFSFQMQLAAEAWYPGYTRKIYLKGLRYNMHLRPRSMLIEVGAQTNTFEEARNAMEPLAELLDLVLSGTAG